MISLEKEKMIGNRLISLLPSLVKAGEARKIEQLVEVALCGQVPPAEVFTFKSRDGREYSLITTASFIRNGDNQPTNLILTMKDISQIKKTEEQLQQTMQELRRSNEELQQFAYVASHDLQEPLRMVTSFVQLLANRYKGKLDDDADEFIGFAVDGARRMQNLIQDLLSYARVESRGREFNACDCNACLGKVLLSLHKKIEENNAIVANSDLPVIMADDTQIMQLFQNLIDNAIKFRGDQGPRIFISAKKRDDDWLFSVQDNGIGIEAQYAERIFIIFQRLHSLKHYSGTGIGLALCKKIVQRHGGSIWMESEAGKGSTFYFTIPVRKEN